MSRIRILRKIRKEFDYQAYCEQNYITKTTNRPDELRICCPHCGEDDYKCYVNDEKKMFNCYKCDFTSGNFDVFDFVSKTEGIPRGKVILRLANEFAPVAPLSIEEIIEMANGTFYEVTEDVPGIPKGIRYIDSLPKEAFPLTDPNNPREVKFWEYLLEDRGLTVDEVKAIKTHYVSQNNVPITKLNGLNEEKYVGNIGRRVLIPVYGPGGSLVSWLSRPITNDFKGPKYLNCPDTDLNRTLWPMVQPYKDIAVITEGIIDALAVRRLGSPFSSYCSFGKSINDDQIKILQDMGITTAILFWDPEERRSKEVGRAIEKLKMSFDEVYVPRFDEWPEGKDPGNMLTEELGIIHLEKSLVDPINVYSLEYITWRFS